MPRRILHRIGLVARHYAGSAASAFAQKSDGQWPRVIENLQATVTVYQPQIESFNDVTLEARAAVSVKAPKKDASIRGGVVPRAHDGQSRCPHRSARLDHGHADEISQRHSRAGSVAEDRN